MLYEGTGLNGGLGRGLMVSTQWNIWNSYNDDVYRIMKFEKES